VAVEDDEAFYYPTDRYPSIYQGITFGTPVFTRTRRKVTFGGVRYPYYQDPGQSATFDYLPDGFKLARVLTAPHVPPLTTVFSNMEQAEDQISCQLAFVALPTIREERLDAAPCRADRVCARTESPWIDGSGPPTNGSRVGRPQPEPADPEKPGGPPAPGGTGDMHMVSLSTGIIDSETMALADFRTVYGALFGGVGTLTGLVQLDARAVPDRDRPGLGSGDRHQGADRGWECHPVGHVSAKVTITNACESTVTFGALSASIWRAPLGSCQQTSPRPPRKCSPHFR
jgi:hypothetical protein